MKKNKKNILVNNQKYIEKQCRRFSNQILYTQIASKKQQQDSSLKNIQYFLPAYLRTKVKKITQFNYNQNNAKILAVINLTISYQNIQGMLFSQIIQILKTKVVIDINGELIKFTSENNKIVIKQQPNKFQISYTYRNTIDLQLVSQTLITPFQKIDGLFICSMKSIQKLKIQRKEGVDEIDSQLIQPQHIANIRFNLMDNIQYQTSKRFEYAGEQEIMGYYLISKHNLGVQYYSDDKQIFQVKKKRNFFDNTNFTNQVKRKYQQMKKKIHYQLIIEPRKRQQSPDLITKKTQKKKNNKINNWHNASFRFQFSKHPLIEILTIMLPLWILAMLNLTIFFQQLALGARITSIATIMLSYVSYLPTIRTRIPPSSSLTLLDGCIYLLISTSIVCLISSFRQYNNDPDGKNLDYRWREDIGFLFSLFVVLGSIIGFIGLYIFYSIFIKSTNSYHETQQRLKQQSDVPYESWSHEVCDYYFYLLSKQGKISINNPLLNEKICDQINIIQDIQQDKDQQERSLIRKSVNDLILQ